MRTITLAVPSLAVAATVCLSGCASIVSGRHADVKLDSHPSNAHVVVRDHHGVEVASARTPAVVSLKRNRKFFLPAKYVATFEASGYRSVDVPLTSSINPWVAGNIVLGGPIGLVVDNATGAAWKPRHDQISQHLTPIYTAQNAQPNLAVETAQLSTIPPTAPGPPGEANSSTSVEPATAIY